MNMRVVGSSALLVGCSAVLGCLAGCAQTDVGPVEETGAKSLPVGSNVRRSTVSEVAPGRPVVLGWERKRTLDGQVLDEMMIDEAPDTDVARLAADQTPDQGGTYYAELVGSFTEGDVVTEYSHVIRQEGTVLNGPTKASFAATPAASRSKKSKVSPELETLLTTRAASDTVRVWVEFEAIPKTRLDEARRSARASLAEADGAQKLMDQAVSARKAEVASLQDPVVREIERLGGKAIDSFWLTNEVIADIPASRVRSLSSHAAVRSLSPVTDTPEPPAAYDGEDIAGSTGVNAGSFLSAGWDGDSDSAHVRKVGIIDNGFFTTHNGYKEGSTGSRVSATYVCSTSAGVVTCTSGAAGTAQNHGTAVAGLAAGDLNDTQDTSVPAADRPKRSGTAQEANLVLVQAGTTPEHKKAIETLVTIADMRVINRSGGTVETGTCDGVTADNIEGAIKAAHDAGVLYIAAAGNEGNAGGCTLRENAQALHAFTVGGVGNNTTTCDNANYATCGVYTSSSKGGIAWKRVLTGGGTANITVRGVDVATNACFNSMFDLSGGYTYNACGTSFAAPVVAGAATLLNDYIIGTWGTPASTSRMFTYLMGMGDRDRAPLAKLLVGTDATWGAGRFQMRRLFAAEAGETYGWEAVSYTVTTGSVVNHLVYGAGAEPAGLKIAKTIMRVNEPDPMLLSNHKLEWFDKDCGAGSGAWAIDSLGENTEHRRVTLGTSAANMALCAKVTVTKTASDANRTVQLFTYYSTLDSMR